MGYAENREGYWRGRYKIATGKYGTVTDTTGATIRFRTKREAKRAADAEEAKVRASFGQRCRIKTKASRRNISGDISARTPAMRRVHRRQASRPLPSRRLSARPRPQDHYEQ
jgi:hypothetical protein